MKVRSSETPRLRLSRSDTSGVASRRRVRPVTLLALALAGAWGPGARAQAVLPAYRDSAAMDESDRVARAAGYSSLRLGRLPKGVREIRIWTDVAITTPDEMYRIVDDRGRVTGSRLLYWRADHRLGPPAGGARTVSLDDVIGHGLAGHCARIVERDSIAVCRTRFTRAPDWNAVLHALEQNEVWTLPDQAALPGGRTFGLDGWTVTVEVRGDSATGATRTTTPTPMRGRRDGKSTCLRRRCAPSTA